MKAALAKWEKEIGVKPLKQHQIDEIEKIIAETKGEKGAKVKGGKKGKKGNADAGGSTDD